MVVWVEAWWLATGRDWLNREWPIFHAASNSFNFFVTSQSMMADSWVYAP